MSQLSSGDHQNSVVEFDEKEISVGTALRSSSKFSALVLFIVTAFAITPSKGQTNADPNPAANNPDKFAWDLFVELNRPALAGKRGIPDPNKAPGDPGLRVWETWKITTENGQEVFLNGAERPKPWDEGLEEKFSPSSRKPVKLLSPPKFTFTRNPGNLATLMATFQARIDKDSGQESRINRPGFDFIVNNCLNSIDGQEAFRKTGKVVDFPIDTIAVKAAWRKFSAAEKSANVSSRYYTAVDENRDLWGLTGFHMTSKALPNWFWATFEQVDNPPPEIPDRDRVTNFLNPPRSDGTRQGVEGRLRKVPAPLQNTVFQYYVLRGTQTGFVDSMGSPTLLGNTQLEGGMQTTSSCMGCHGRATIGDRLDNIAVDGRPLYPPGTFFYPGGKISCLDPDGKICSNRLTVDVSETFWQQDPQKPNRNDAVALVASTNGGPNPNWFIEAGSKALSYIRLGSCGPCRRAISFHSHPVAAFGLAQMHNDHAAT